jgi:hypothetical protein
MGKQAEEERRVTITGDNKSAGQLVPRAHCSPRRQPTNGGRRALTLKIAYSRASQVIPWVSGGAWARPLVLCGRLACMHDAAARGAGASQASGLIVEGGLLAAAASIHVDAGGAPPTAAVAAAAAAT